MNLLDLFLIVLATARLTRLVTTDVLTQGPRDRLVFWLADRGPVRDKLAYLIVCDWCASMYVGAAVAGAWWAWGDTMWLMMVYAALAASYATGFLASKTGE
jgi:hypothetical protein